MSCQIKSVHTHTYRLWSHLVLMYDLFNDAITPAVQRWKPWWLNNEQERVWKEAVVAYFKVLYRACLKELRKATNLSEDTFRIAIWTNNAAKQRRFLVAETCSHHYVSVIVHNLYLWKWLCWKDYREAFIYLYTRNTAKWNKWKFQGPLDRKFMPTLFQLFEYIVKRYTHARVFCSFPSNGLGCHALFSVWTGKQPIINSVT